MAMRRHDGDMGTSTANARQCFESYIEYLLKKLQE